MVTSDQSLEVGADLHEMFSLRSKLAWTGNVEIHEQAEWYQIILDAALSDPNTPSREGFYFGATLLATNI